MKRYIRAIFVCAVVIFYVPVVSFVFYSGYSFIKNSDNIRSIISNSDHEDRYPTETVKRYIRLSVGSNDIPKWAVARLLATQFGYSENVSPIAWQFNWASWYVIVKTMLDDDEIYALFCSLSYNGEDHGLNKLSIRLFGKRLSELPEESVAKLLAYEKSPSYFNKHQDILNENAKKLFERAKNI